MFSSKAKESIILGALAGIGTLLGMLLLIIYSKFLLVNLTISIPIYLLVILIILWRVKVNLTSLISFAITIGLTIFCVSQISFYHDYSAPIKAEIKIDNKMDIAPSEYAKSALDWIAFYYNDSMFLNNRYTIKASIEPEKGASLNMHYVSSAPKYKTISATPGLKYKLALTGGDAFDISLEEGIEIEQIFNPEMPAIWIWFAVPKLVGKHNLTLTAYSVVGGYEAKVIEDWPVTVVIRPKNFNDYIDDLVYFISTYWQWIICTIISIIPFILGWKRPELGKKVLDKSKYLTRKIIQMIKRQF